MTIWHSNKARYKRCLHEERGHFAWLPHIGVVFTVAVHFVAFEIHEVLLAVLVYYERIVEYS